MITLYNVKGGVGKSSLAFQLAKHYSLPLYTNDIYSALTDIHKIDPKEKKSELPDCVLDLGGFSDHRIASYIKNSDVIIIPTLYSKLDLQSTVLTTRDIIEVKPDAKIIIVINKTRSNDGKMIDETKRTLGKYLPFDAQYIEIRASKCFYHSVNSGQSIFEIYNANKMNKKYYVNTINSVYELITEIDNLKGV
ncbi:MAG: hypothetical protein U9Q90_01935 [Campylobacterota bacterium]|nr:hypothetical protein [Campylobacterota bacterium]